MARSASTESTRSTAAATTITAAVTPNAAQSNSDFLLALTPVVASFAVQFDEAVAPVTIWDVPVVLSVDDVIIAWYTNDFWGRPIVGDGADGTADHQMAIPVAGWWQRRRRLFAATGSGQDGFEQHRKIHTGAANFPPPPLNPVPPVPPAPPVTVAGW